MMKEIFPSRGPETFERNSNLCHLIGTSNNDNLCHFTGVEPKLPSFSYPQYDVGVICLPSRFLLLRKLPAELRRFSEKFEERHKTIFCCQPIPAPAYRPVSPIPPAVFWTQVDLYVLTPYCRPGGKAIPSFVMPYPNLGLYFPPYDFFRVHC
ncbi:unnamed protein product [Candidula unifasciata]|uniref:Uncharacterized protein n=1 Tax=Candidula unifasciata TaxID=100452 RepID=A0A8S3ZDP3_9EUPU|nr:unnamed protein product [Candidula unifasciata]